MISLLKRIRTPKSPLTEASPAALREVDRAWPGPTQPASTVGAEPVQALAPTPSVVAAGPQGQVQRIVVIGNGMVGYDLLARLVERDTNQQCRITVFGEEPRPAYDRIHLTDYLRGRHDDDLLLAPRQWYRQHKIDLHVGDPVVAIDRAAKVVKSASGIEAPYDKLILATGSAPFVPPIPGADQPGVFVYRTIEDLKAINAFAHAARHAIVIGGGLLGLEAARALRDMHLDVHVIEMATGLMPQQLEPSNAAALQEHVRRMGLKLHLSRRTKRIERSDDGLTVHFERSAPIDADMIVISAGIRPRDELARACGLDIGLAGGGVIVNDRLETSDPSIHAIGECARHRGLIYGLAAPGYAMADVLASNLLGADRQFEGADTSTRLKMLGIDVAVLGEYRADCQSVSWSGTGTRRQLLLRDGRLIGAVVIGPWDETARLQEAISTRRRVGSRRLSRFRTTGDLWPNTATESIADWPDTAMVCNCIGVTCATLRSHIADGCTSIDHIAAKCRASTVCGSCKPLIGELLGAPAPSEPVKGTRRLLGVSVAALIAALLFVLLRPLPFATSVQSVWHQLDVVWRNGVWRQASGFTLLGLSLLGLVLSGRKRIKRFSFGSFGIWRVIHALFGLTALATLIAHTGMRFGANLNMALMTCFVGLNLLGAAAGLVTAWEGKRGGPAGSVALARKWRPWFTWAHIVLFWPLPVFIAFHILSVYYF